MPYIKKKDRELLNYNKRLPINAGELNYCITQLLIDYIDTKDLCYQNINDVLGVLEGAKLEFYRRVATPYEQQKIKENGDVY